MEGHYIESILFNGNITRTSYLKTLSVVKFLEKKKELPFSNDVTFLVGENGMG